VMHHGIDLWEQPVVRNSAQREDVVGVLPLRRMIIRGQTTNFGLSTRFIRPHQAMRAAAYRPLCRRRLAATAAARPALGEDGLDVGKAHGLNDRVRHGLCSVRRANVACVLHVCEL